jgi:LacI family transcriptional regulator
VKSEVVVMMKPRVSQQDVAQLAGVSRATVSYVINDVDGISITPETRERVWAAVKELGFRPNAMARGLRAQSSGVLGLVTSEIATTPYAVEIIKGAQDAAFDYGKTLLIIDSEGDTDATEEAIGMMAGWQVDGVMLAADFHRRIVLPRGLTSFRHVLVHCFDADGLVPAVVPDEVQGGRLATETLLASGHSRIGFLNGPIDYPAAQGRLQGYREALEAAGIAYDASLVRSGSWWQETGIEHAADLVTGPGAATALFCGNDWIAMGAYDGLREIGLSVPGDVSIVGFDDRREIAAHMRPALTSVALPYQQMGRWAVEFLLDPEGPQQHRGTHLIKCPLVRRDSVAAPPATVTASAREAVPPTA